MKRNNLKTLTMSLMAVSLIAGCGKVENSNSTSTKPGTTTSTSATNPNKKYNEEVDPIIFSSDDFDGVFNPYYSTSGADNSVIGMTQISMFTTDKNANIAYGDDEPVVVKDYEQVYDESSDTTTYTFAIKNNVRYSDGSYLTLQDVLFNMYEYLDPVYTGSSTMYSTDIIGLKEYRTQQADEKAQEAFASKFKSEANERVSQLVSVMKEIAEEHKSEQLTIEKYNQYLTAKETQYSGNTAYKYSQNFVEDFAYIQETFKEELETDYKNSVGSYVDDDDLNSDAEYFLYREGLIRIDLDKDKGEKDRITYVLGEPITKALTEQELGGDSEGAKKKALEYAFNYYMPAQVTTIASYWATASTIRTTYEAEAKEKYFSTNTERPFKNISGIKVITENTKIGDKTYNYARYNAKGEKVEGADNGVELFSITIDGVDPKAIWNFGFSVSPMSYYSSPEEIAKFDYTENFGVTYSSTTFQDTYVKGDSDHIGIPVGAGAYMASSSDLKPTKKANEFKKDNIVYFERNPYFVMGKAKVKYIRYQVVPNQLLISALKSGQIHYCTPQAKTENIAALNKLENEGITYAQAKTLGYGYIGVNPKYVPSIYARRAIMSTMDTSLTINYYAGSAEVIYRPMSKVSWAYPENCTEYESIAFDYTGETAKKLLKQAGYEQNSKGAMVDKNGNQFKYTFTIAGDSTDHPSYQTFLDSADILNELGCDITVKNDNNALSKLSSGDLAVWAAAWGSTIDPDMYQVYHKDSAATSVLNWGYKQILSESKYTYQGTQYDFQEEKAIVNDLSELIDAGRETLDQEERKTIYAQALDLVMDLAVELPTYQRNDLFAYNASYLDTDTMTPKSELSPYNGPIDRIYKLGLK